MASADSLIIEAIYHTDYKSLFEALVSEARMKAQDKYFLEHEREFIETIGERGSYLLLKSDQNKAGEAAVQAIYKEVYEYIKSK